MRDAGSTIRLNRELDRKQTLEARSGKTKSELAREALRRQVALSEIARLRRRVVPFAEAHGYLTDEDVSRDVS